MDIKRDLLIAQIVNFALLFFLVKGLFGDKIIKAIEERKQLIKKLKLADDEYARMIELAKKESNNIITKANQKKMMILSEGRVLADEERRKVLDLAMSKSEMMLTEAKEKGKKMLKDLESGWVDSVKATTQVVVCKLLDTHEELKEEYLQTVVKELKKSPKKVA
ncbi:MAG: ATP synthase F0 subunit B [Candidatus Peribacteria bacterium]|jgi:F0F1-type ATP synthase membrane subunit b/b'|nr:ATP synthase F0 subunit B [Candidatus Peribacteria bacterium]